MYGLQTGPPGDPAFQSVVSKLKHAALKLETIVLKVGIGVLKVRKGDSNLQFVDFELRNAVLKLGNAFLKLQNTLLKLQYALLRAPHWRPPALQPSRRFPGSAFSQAGLFQSVADSEGRSSGRPFSDWDPKWHPKLSESRGSPS
jgi:hypothetical protein